MLKYFTCLILLPFNLAAQPSTTHIDSVMQLHKDFNGVVLVADKGDVKYHKAFGYRDYAQGIPLQKDDLFEMASISKTVTSMIIMMLKEKGKLNYDDPIEKYVQVPYKNIKIRHLLTHTSGLPDYMQVMDKYWDKNKIAGNKEILGYLNRYNPPILFEPGAKYEYSNTGYVLLASIAEKAGGKDFIKMCRKWIFKPLKMRSTDIRTVQETKSIKNFAVGHIFIPGRKQYVRADSFPSSDYTIWLGNRTGPGRVSSTTTDLLKWDQALYTNKLVKQSTLQEAFLQMKLINDSVSNYGLGWMLETDSTLGKTVYHTGSNPGYRNRFIRYVDSRRTIILFSNNAYEKLIAIARLINSK
ncbi:MAG TPA: serine hydrolase domain-containing protein [Segetibacter sp.]